MYKILAFIFFLINSITHAQQIKYFNISPLITQGIEGQSIFYEVTCDSNYIYVLGDYPYIYDSTKMISDIQTYLAKIDYQGNKIYQTDLNIDPDGFYIGNKSWLKLNKNRNTYYHIVVYFDGKIPNGINGNWCLQEIELSSGRVIKNYKIDVTKDPRAYDVLPRFDYDGNNSIIVTGGIELKGVPHYYILQLDTNFNLVKLDTINTTPLRLVPVRILFNQNSFDLITEQYSMTWKYAGVTYLKLAKDMNILKQKKMDLDFHYRITNADEFTYHKIPNNGDWIFMSEYVKDSNVGLLNKKPQVIRMSPEFDTVRWVRQMYNETVHDSMTHNVQASVLCSDGSGIIVSGDIDVEARKLKLANYGLIFKVALNGDSLWLRKIVPIGLDTFASTYIHLVPVVETPYQTYAAVGFFRTDKYNPWLIHFDTHGCLIPGCDQTVSTDDIKNKKEKAFLVYPNPTVSDYVYIQSRINAEAVHLDLINLQGQIIKSKQMKMEQGVQYILSLEQDIPIGEYIFRLQSGDIVQNEKMIIAR